MGTPWTTPSTTTAPAGRNDDADRLLLVGLVIAALLVAVVLAVGHVSALLVHHGWPRYRTGDVPGIVYRVAKGPADPGRAWDPVNLGAAPPGPVAWWLTFAALAALPTISFAYLRRRQDNARQPNGGQWATRRTLRRLRVRTARSGRLILGRGEHRSLLAVETRHSLLVLGPTQSGKTSGLALPAILDWPGPVVATSIKGDLVDHTIGWRSQQGEVHVYDPAGSTSFRASGWSPLAGAQDWGGANRAAWDLAKAGRATAGEGVNLAGLWYGAAAKALAPMLYAAANTGRSIADVARWVDAEERDDVVAMLRPLNSDARLAHEATFKLDDRHRSSIFQIMQQVVGTYLDPAVAYSAEHHDIVPADFVSGAANTLYLVAPPRDQERFRPLFAALVDQVLSAVYERTAATGRPLDPPLLLLLDEAANIAPVEDLPLIASTAAALGLQLVTVFQDVAQIKLRYGLASGTVINNHRAKLVLPGNSDLDTLDLTSRLAGEEETDRESVTVDSGGRKSNTTAAQWRRLLPPELVRQLDDGEGVLLYGNLPPVRLRLRLWFKDRRLRRRAETPQDLIPPVAPASPPTSAPPPPPPARHLEPAIAIAPPSPSGVSILDAARARRARQAGGEQ